MPRRAAPGDRRAIEAALGPSLRAALQELRELFDVECWQLSPLGPVFQVAAALLVAEGLEEREGMSRFAAITLAAVSLGLDPDAVRKRVGRWPRESRADITSVTSPRRGVRLRS